MEGAWVAASSEINQTEKDKHHIILFIHERKKKYKLTYLQNIKNVKNKLTGVYGEEGGIGSLGLTYTDYNV